MRRMLALAVAGLPLWFAGTALAQPAAAPPGTCDVVAQSQVGGLVEAVTAGAKAAPAHVVWRPPASNGRIEVLVSYHGPLDNIGEPDGVLMRFPLDPNDPPDTVALVVTSTNGRQWRFTGQVRDPGGDATGHVEFDDKLVYGRALLGAIADGQKLSIVAERYDRTLATTLFSMDNQRARDVLVAQAKRRIESGDPTACPKG